MFNGREENGFIIMKFSEEIYANFYYTFFVVIYTLVAMMNATLSKVLVNAYHRGGARQKHFKTN